MRPLSQHASRAKYCVVGYVGEMRLSIKDKAFYARAEYYPGTLA